MKDYRFHRQAIKSENLSVVTSASRAVTVLDAFRPARDSVADSIAGAEDPDEALEKYTAVASRMNYQEAGMPMPRSLEEINREKKEVQEIKRRAGRGRKGNYRMIAMATLAVLAMLATVALTLIGIQEDDGNSAGNEGDTPPSTVGETAGPVEPVAFELNTPLQLQELQSICYSQRISFGGRLPLSERWFACLPDNSFFSCEVSEDEDKIRTCNDDDDDEEDDDDVDFCLCPGDNLFHHVIDHCKDADEFNQTRHCKVFDTSSFPVGLI